MEKLTHQIIRFKWLILLSVIVLTVFFSFQIRNIRINTDILASLPEDDVVAQLYLQIGEEFGGNDMGMIVLETDNVFSPEVLMHVKQITDSITYIEGVSSVSSLTNIMDIKSSEWGIEIGKLVDEYALPETQAEVDSLKEYVNSKSMYKGSIVSNDGTATLIVFTLLPESDKQFTANQIKAKVKSLNLSEKIYFGGLPIMMSDVGELILTDIFRLVPLVFLLIALILFLSFRTARGVILPLLTAGISVIWTVGLMALMGYELTIISDIIPVVLLAVGSAYTIHVLNSMNNTGLTDPKKILVKGVSMIIIPVVLASLTTAIGFISFVFGSYLAMIRDFGIFTAIGTLAALVLSISFVPALISVLPLPKKSSKTHSDSQSNYVSDKFLQPMVKMMIKHPKASIASWGAVLLFFIVGLFFIKTSVNMTGYFKKDFPSRVSEEVLQNKFGGSMPVFVIFEGDMQSPEVLQTMRKTEEFMKLDSSLSVTQSVAGLIEQMNDAMGEGLEIPDEKAKIEQLWFLLDGQDIMSQLVNADLSKGIIQSRFASIDTKEIDAFSQRLNAFIQENSREDCKIQLTGIPSVYVQLNNSLIKSQVSSLLLAIAMVLLIVSLILRSLSKGIYTCIPVIATTIILMGFMGLTGIPIDIATVLVASIALGIGIDYSIHVITGFNNQFKIHGNVEKAIEGVVSSVGKAVVINVASVSIGFLVLLLSQLVPLQNFGLLVAVSMVASGISALSLLPVVLILANRRHERSLNKQQQ